VLFYADDWRYDTLGATGNPLLQIPVLDALGQEVVWFTKNCVTTFIYLVSRATLLCGQYLVRHRFEMLGRGRTVMADGQKKEMGVLQNETLNRGILAVGEVGPLVEL
jgi:arylsulfatase A-like enzyme